MRGALVLRNAKHQPRRNDGWGGGRKRESCPSWDTYQVFLEGFWWLMMVNPNFCARSARGQVFTRRYWAAFFEYNYTNLGSKSARTQQNHPRTCNKTLRCHKTAKPGFSSSVFQHMTRFFKCVVVWEGVGWRALPAFRQTQSKTRIISWFSVCFRRPDRGGSSHSVCCSVHIIRVREDTNVTRDDERKSIEGRQEKGVLHPWASYHIRACW